MPERQIPVLIDCEPGKHEGFVPSIVCSDKPLTAVRRLQPQEIAAALANPQESGLRELVVLLERVNAGDYSPVVESSKPHVTRGREGNLVEIQLGFKMTGKTLRFAITEAFTKGLSKVRFVVWWSAVANRFVPGFYCPDLATALYAALLSKIGTPGGVGVCQRCRTPFPRSRASQLYCSHKCQVAAAMTRYRKKIKKVARSKSKNTARRQV